MKLRLAFREEGEFWNCYLARPDTMVDAKLIGMILMGAVIRNPKVKTGFMATMKLALADAIEEFSGKRPEKWDTQKAPEHERIKE